MSMLQMIRCNVCGDKAVEKDEGAGFPGWGQLMGIILNKVPNPHLCPRHLRHIADEVSKLTDLNRPKIVTPINKGH